MTVCVSASRSSLSSRSLPSGLGEQQTRWVAPPPPTPSSPSSTFRTDQGCVSKASTAPQPTSLFRNVQPRLSQALPKALCERPSEVSSRPPIPRPVLSILGRHCMPEKRTTLLHSLRWAEDGARPRGGRHRWLLDASQPASPIKTWIQKLPALSQQEPDGADSEYQKQNPCAVPLYPAHQRDRTTSRRP